MNIQQRIYSVRQSRFLSLNFLEYVSNQDRSEIEKECPIKSSNTRENVQCTQTSHLSFIEFRLEFTKGKDEVPLSSTKLAFVISQKPKFNIIRLQAINITGNVM